tara:strand:+ start:2600 stop:2872 length:273 start_codon:yes stop_codon:yes gene_type:complete
MKKTNEDKLWLLISQRVAQVLDGGIPNGELAIISGGTGTGSSSYSKPNVEELYESIEHYTKQTGKRFRMTKDQKDRNLTREQAFKETHSK